MTASPAGSEGTGASSPESGPNSGTRARPRLAAAGIAGLEGLAFAGLAVVELVAAVIERAGGAVAAAVFFAACAGGLGWCARGLALRESWSRGPLVAAQLLLLALSWSYHRPYPVAAGVLALASAVALVLLLLPSTTRALDDHPGAPRVD